MKNYKYLIVGGGMTADAAVHGIREIDLNGKIGCLAWQTSLQPAMSLNFITLPWANLSE